MDSRWFSPVVVLLWVSTTAWLTVDKILPQLRSGDPPTYRTLRDQADEDNLVKWDIYLKNQVVGQSTSRVEKLGNGHLEVLGNLWLTDLSLADLLPERLRDTLLPSLDVNWTKKVELNSQLEVNAAGRLMGMEATLRWGDTEDFLRLSGVVVGNELRLVPQFFNKFSLPEIKIPIASEQQMVDSFSPQSRLKGLRLGQAWSIPLFSPLQPTDPIEILQAVVAREEPIFWNGDTWNTYVVEYRKSTGAGGPQEVRAQMWVRFDGLVIKQQAALLSSQLVFIRCARNEGSDKP